MSKFTKIGIGICAVCLVAFMLLAGCASQPSENSQGQTPGPQSGSTAGAQSESTQVTTPGNVNQGSTNPETGLFVDDSGNTPVPSEQVTLAPDLPVGESNGLAGQNLTPDSTDFGDITP